MHDLRACLRNIVSCIDRGAERVGAPRPSNVPTLVAVLLWSGGLHELFHEYVVVARNPRKFMPPKSIVMEGGGAVFSAPARWLDAAASEGSQFEILDKACAEERAYRERRAAIRQRVAESEPGVLRRASLTLLSREISLLVRDRRNVGADR